MLWYSLEVHQLAQPMLSWGTINEYHKIYFYGEVRKISEIFSWKKTKQEDHDGPISLTWANRFAYLLLKIQPSSLL